MRKTSRKQADSQREYRRSQQAIRKSKESRSPFGRLSREQMEKVVEVAMLDDGRCMANVEGREIELLADRKGNSSKLNPWASKKESSRILAASYNRLAESARASGDLQKAEEFEKRADHTGSCANTMIFVSLTDKEGKKHLTPLNTQFCHDPLCPMCEWRTSVKTTVLLAETLGRIASREDQKVRLLHLVLTVPNVRPDELGETIEAMHDGLGKMRQQAWWEKRVLGYFAKTEYTWSNNPEMIRQGTTLHPHMHLLLVVPAEYFDRVPAWRENLADVFRAVGYGPRRSAGRCRSFDAAINSVHAAVARKLIEDMEAEQLSEEEALKESKGVVTQADSESIRARLFSKYRKRYWRMVSPVDEIASEYRPPASADAETVKNAVKAFASAVAEAADPLYINEPKDHVFLDAWRSVMGNPDITDVQLNAVTTCAGQPLRDSSFEAQKDAVKELAKYVCKSADYLFPNDPDLTDERVEILLRQLTGCRMTSAGGIVAKIIAEVKEEWKAQDEEEDEDCSDGSDSSAEIVVATWSQVLHAYIVERYPMTSDALDAIEYLTHMTVPRRFRARCRDVRVAITLAA